MKAILIFISISLSLPTLWAESQMTPSSIDSLKDLTDIFSEGLPGTLIVASKNEAALSGNKILELNKDKCTELDWKYSQKSIWIDNSELCKAVRILIKEYVDHSEDYLKSNK